MRFEIIERHLINNKGTIWKIIRRSKNYSNCLIDHNAIFRGCIVKNNGKNNRIIVESGARVCYCTFSINGDNNTIHIKKNSVINGCVFLSDDNWNEIQIGENSTFTGKTELIVTEGTKIIIGKDCMFAYGIVVRTGDHHSILDDKGERINLSKDIVIGNHVWIAQNAFLLKGVQIDDNCIIGACSVVTKSFQGKKLVLAGNPAKVIKTDVSWTRERL